MGDEPHLITNDLTKIYLGFNRSITDYPGYDPKYRLEIPGKYEISYIVYASNFPPARATFLLDLKKDIEEITFNKVTQTNFVIKRHFEPDLSSTPN